MPSTVRSILKKLWFERYVKEVFIYSKRVLWRWIMLEVGLANMDVKLFAKFFQAEASNPN